VLTDYREELLKHWATDDSRVLGHVLYSPPMDVGGEYKLIDLVLMMPRNPKNVHEFSYTRDDKGRVSKQWPILPIPNAQVRSNNYGWNATFGAVGESGAVVVDAVGRVGGIVACGAGDREWQFDVTYVTPVGAVLDFVKAGKGLEGVKMRKGPDKETLRKLPF